MEKNRLVRTNQGARRGCLAVVLASMAMRLCSTDGLCANPKPNVLVLSEETRGNEALPEPAFARSIRTALEHQLKLSGFSVLDQRALTGAYLRENTALQDRWKACEAAGAAAVPVDFVIFFSTEIYLQNLDFLSTSRLRISATMLDCNVAEVVAAQEIASPTPVTLPVDCDVACLEELLRDEVAVLAGDLVHALAKSADRSENAPTSRTEQFERTYELCLVGLDRSVLERAVARWERRFSMRPFEIRSARWCFHLRASVDPGVIYEALRTQLNDLNVDADVTYIDSKFVVLGQREE